MINLTCAVSMTPSPSQRGEVSTLGVSAVTPPIAGLLNDPVEMGFINPSPWNLHSGATPPLKGEVTHLG